MLVGQGSNPRLLAPLTASRSGSSRWLRMGRRKLQTMSDESVQRGLSLLKPSWIFPAARGH